MDIGIVRHNGDGRAGVQEAAFEEDFPEMAEQWLLMSSLPVSDTDFILRNLCSLPQPLFSQQQVR